jgi:hypothetical protein
MLGGENRPKRRRTKRVCSNCFQAKSGCDAERPCGRCVRLRKIDCVDRALSLKELQSEFLFLFVIDTAVLVSLQSSVALAGGCASLMVFDLSLF